MERRRLFLMRASFLATALVVLAFAAWVLPWVPAGMAGDDYELRIAVAVLLGVAASVAVPSFLVLWGGTFRNESLPEFVRVLFGGHQFIRGREQFRSRLRAECGRARRNRRYVFSILVIEHPVEPDASGLTTEPEERRFVVLHVRTAVRAQDVVATGTSTQVWVLLQGANEHATRSVIVRLTEELQGLACRVGAATFGVDGERPGALLIAATERLVPVDARLEQRAA